MQPRLHSASLVWQLPVPEGQPRPPVPAGSMPRHPDLAALTSCLAGHVLHFVEPSPYVPRVVQSWHVYEADTGGLNTIVLYLPPGHVAVSTVDSWPQ